MKLSREVPRHIHTVIFKWCKPDFMPYCEKYRKPMSGAKPPNTCFWCGHKFKDGEMMAFARRDTGVNKLLCQSCAAELVASGKESP